MVILGSRMGKCSLFINAQKILFYNAIDNEVDLISAIIFSLEQGKNVILPITNKIQGTLELREIKQYPQDLVTGEYEIMVPASYCQVVDPTSLDLVIVPGIAFDMNGNRVGYGKGYYDTLLRELNTEKIGIAYDFQIVPKIIVQDHDVPMNSILTESRILECS